MTDIVLTRPTLLCMFSGGLDSLGVLYKLVTELQYNQFDVHVHHIHIINSEMRYVAEEIACQAILKELDTMPNLKKITYSECSFEIPSFKTLPLLDADVYNFVAGNLTKRIPFLVRTAISRTKDDIADGTVDALGSTPDAIFGYYTDPGLKFYPVANMTKKEIYKMLPNNLRTLAWSCSTPIKRGDRYTECGGCKSCLQMKEVRKSV